MARYLILKKELKENQWVFIIGLIALVASAAVNVFSYDVISQLIKNTDTMNLPEIAIEQLKLIKDYPSYIWFSWFGKSFTQGAVVLAILLGMGTIAKEVSKGTISFLLSKPFTREKVLFEKYLSGALMLAILTFGSAKVLYLMSLATGQDIDLLKLTLGSLNVFAGLLVIYSLAVLFSTYFNDRLKAGLITGVITLTSIIPKFFPDLADYDFFSYLQGSKIFYGEGFPYGSFIGFILASVVIYVLSLKSLRNKQF